MHRTPTLDAVVQNVYTGPTAELLERRATAAYVYGTVRIEDFEIRTSIEGSDRAFIAILQARVIATIDEMVDALTITTLPGHDPAGIVGAGGQTMAP